MLSIKVFLCTWSYCICQGAYLLGYAYVLSQIKALTLKGSLDISLKVYLMGYGNGVIQEKRQENIWLEQK